ncbi:GNAT family N-acetyltransferase [Mesobacillus jeotgali]|uniref:GNAT family N-acetyltransferase n=1 Tax=Mesobacillus jeotgali TaxID=129985 RepID=UPI0021488441|nr:GNAT family protein [Mesobacillus jeotgali]
MELESKRMTRDLAVKILGWKYESPFELYNNDVSEESIKELIDQGYFAVEDQNDGSLIGFYCTGSSAQVPAGKKFGAYSEPAIDIGIGMEPNLTGKGHGFNFFSFVIKELNGDKPPKSLRLTVAKFNKRAIRLYEKSGFKYKSEFKTETNEFITMVKC